MVVREGRGGGAAKIDTVRGGRGGGGGVGERGKGRRVHAREVVGPRRGQEGGWICDAAAPLEDECYGCQGDREEGEEEEDLRDEGVRKRGRRGEGGRVGAERSMELVVAGHVRLVGG